MTTGKSIRASVDSMLGLAKLHTTEDSILQCVEASAAGALRVRCCWCCPFQVIMITLFTRLLSFGTGVVSVSQPHYTVPNCLLILSQLSFHFKHFFLPTITNHCAFCEQSLGEIFELKAELNSDKKDRKKEAVKKVIASMTVGKDVRWVKGAHTVTAY